MYKLINNLVTTFVCSVQAEGGKGASVRGGLCPTPVSSLMMLWWLMKCCMGQRFATSVNAVVWIAELVHVKKSWKLVKINLTTLF